jgi:hypothetical protein
MNIFLKLIIGGLVFFACQQTGKKREISKLPVSNDSHKNFLLSDTLFYQNDTVVAFDKVDDGLGIIFRWGTNKYINVGKDTLPYSSYGYTSLLKNDKYYAIQTGCGTACNYLYLMSFVAGNQGKLFMYPLLVNLDKDLVVFQNGESSVLAKVEQITTNQNFVINEKYDTTRRPYNLAIDTLFVENDTLILSWYLDKSKMVTKKFSLMSMFN